MCGAVTPLTYAFIISRYFLQTTIAFVTFLITGVLIDVSEKMKYNDFQITAEDIIAREKEHCPFQEDLFLWFVSVGHLCTVITVGLISDLWTEAPRKCNSLVKREKTSPPGSSFRQTKQYQWSSSAVNTWYTLQVIISYDRVTIRLYATCKQFSVETY